MGTPALIARPYGPVRDYLRDRFPLVSNGGAVLSSFVCSYLLYGQAQEEQVLEPVAVAGAVAFVLLFLQRRIVDDIEDVRDDLAERGTSLDAAEGRRRLHGLLLGAAAVSALVVAINAAASEDLFLVSLVLVAWPPTATVIKRRVWRVRLLRYLVNETCPALIISYVYVVWREAGGEALSAASVAATIALFWIVYEWWVFTRKIGEPSDGWPPWELTMAGTRRALMAFLALYLACSVALAASADVSAVFVAYNVAAAVAFAVLILRWWSRLPPGEDASQRVPARWGGLPFAATVQVGVLLGVLASELGI